MQVSQQAQAVLLLTAYFAKPRAADPKPLTPKEWGRFALWLKDQSLKPAQLILGDPRPVLEKWHDRTITAERVEQLLGRGSAFALAMEKWTRAGLWVLTRSDADYPRRLKNRLGQDAPAVLFGCGNRKLLDSGGVAVVGSRRASDEDRGFAATLGRRAAQDGLSIVSGGARGIDEAAMLAALEADGTVVGVLSNSLLQVTSSQRYRQHLMDGNAALVSPFYPEAGFNAGNAMARNKYIYCLADAAVVVHSGNKGGTWTGALETLKNKWVPVWVKPCADPDAGNAAIIRKGGLPLPDEVADITLSSLTQPKPGKVPTTSELLSIKDDAPVPKDTGDIAAAGEDTALGAVSVYDVFLFHVRRLCRDNPQSPAAIAEALGIVTSQANAWLKQATAEGALTKLSRPVRYATADQTNPPQTALF